jgi:NAD dependent epimerase/dehydratase
VGKQVLVTGADGFIGSHLTSKLVEEGYGVRAMVYYNSWNSIGWLADLPADQLSCVELIFGDVRDVGFIKQAIAGINEVFHLAALIAIPYSYVAPSSYVDTNINGTLNVLQACQESDCIDRVLVTSTSEVYGSAQYVPMDECHPLVGQSPYAASKIGADQLALSFHRSYGLPVFLARPFNTFGPRQTARAVIPTLLSQVAARSRGIKLGDLSPKRDFNYVGNTVSALSFLMQCANLEMGEVVNIGSGEEHSILELIQLVEDITGMPLEVLEDKQRVRPTGSEVNRLLANIEKISQLGWSPQVSFKEGLIETYSWIEKNMNLFEAGKYSI